MKEPISVLGHGRWFFYDRHRVANDCEAAIELLASRLPGTGAPAIGQLLARARHPSGRIWAENAAFDLKDTLKARGYRWNGDGNPSPCAWYIDVDDDVKELELLAYLRAEIYQREVELIIRKITAYERFSDQDRA